VGQRSFAVGWIHPELDPKGQLGFEEGFGHPASPLSHWHRIRAATTVHTMDERYGLMLVPSLESGQSVDDAVAQRKRDGWQLVSTRIDKEGAEVMVFRRRA
jgi:hypothetical protein